MNLHFPSRKSFVLSLACFTVFCMLLSWLVLPRVLQSQAEAYVTGRSGHHLSMNRPEFNPFQLSLRLSGVRLAEPDDKTLLAFRELVVDLSAASLFRGALIFDGIRLDGLEVSAVLLANGRLNWSALMDKVQSRETATHSPLPRFNVHRFMLSGTRLDFSDKRMVPAFSARIEPIDLELTEFSSLPGDTGRYRLSARTTSGARLAWQGEGRLDSLTTTGHFSIEELDLASLSPLFRDRVAFVRGAAGLSANYRLAYANGHPEINLDQVAARLTEFELVVTAGPVVRANAIEAKNGSFDLAKNSFALGSLRLSGSRLQRDSSLIELGNLSVEEVGVKLGLHQATLGRIALGGGHIRVARDVRGQIDLLDAFKTMTVSPAATGIPWHYRLNKFELAGFDAAFLDKTVSPAAQLAVKDITLDAAGISDDWSVAVPLKVSFNAMDGGRFTAEGRVVPAGPTADIECNLIELGLKAAQPYLSSVARLRLADGHLSAAGRASFNEQAAGFKGRFELRDLQLFEADTGNLFMAWKSLGSHSIDLSPKKLDMGELTVSGLDTKLIINKDKSFSFSRILQPAGAKAPAAQGYAVNIDKLRIVQGEMDFADYSLSLPFGTRIHDIKGVINGLSTRPDAMGQLELDGQVDAYGVARAVGQIDLMNPTDFTDIRLAFRNIEMSGLTPYSATFAGRKITSGKLSLDLEYKIKQRKLLGTSRVVMDRLTLGERVESPDARDLPLDLAIAILQDSDGRIELGLPVSGSLDDPQFSYGGVVWQAIANVFAKIVTAPFRALGALFGGDDKFEDIVFAVGSAELTPPEREKLVHLADILTKRPALFMSVRGVYAETDRVALQDLQLRRAVAKMSGQHLEADEAPGPVAVQQPKNRSALETLFSDRVGGAELAALKDGFRRANPGTLEESATGKVISGLKGLFREKRALSDQEVAKLAGADFYAVLYDRLRSNVIVDEKQLLELAAARGAATVAAMKEAGAPSGRLSLLPAEKVAAEGRDVPVGMVPGTAPPEIR